MLSFKNQCVLLFHMKYYHFVIITPTIKIHFGLVFSLLDGLKVELFSVYLSWQHSHTHLPNLPNFYRCPYLVCERRSGWLDQCVIIHNMWHAFMHDHDISHTLGTNFEAMDLRHLLDNVQTFRQPLSNHLWQTSWKHRIRIEKRS